LTDFQNSFTDTLSTLLKIYCNITIEQNAAFFEPHRGSISIGCVICQTLGKKLDQPVVIRQVFVHINKSLNIIFD